MNSLKLSITLAMVAISTSAVVDALAITVIGSDSATVSKTVKVADFPAPDGNGAITVIVDFAAGEIATGSFTGSVISINSDAHAIGSAVSFDGVIPETVAAPSPSPAPAPNMQPVPVTVSVFIG